MDPDQALVRRLAPKYLGGLTHVHTIASNFRHHHESNLTLERVHAGLLAMPEHPWKFIALAEHTANPARPHLLGERSPRYDALEADAPKLARTQLIRGVEVSILANGSLDVPKAFLDGQGLVIASRHTLPRRIEKHPARIKEHFLSACRHPAVDVLGHPNRYVLEVGGVDWPGIFAAARRSGTAIEINLNIFPRWPRIGGQRLMNRGMRRWDAWLAALARSGAPVFIGTDIHQHTQLQQLQREWLRAAGGVPSARHDRLFRLVTALHGLGITPDRVVSRNHRALAAWLATPKSQRKDETP